MLYKKIYIENLDAIKRQSLDLFPTDYYSKNTLFYIDNNQEQFFNIEPLNQFLEDSCLKKNVVGFGFYITQPNTTGGIHTDTGSFDYSLNIPISGCEESSVCFYDCYHLPIYKKLSETVGYNSYAHAVCREIDSFKFTDPYIINVKVPHRVVNNKNSIRISLLIRLSNLDNMSGTASRN